ncbi:BTAD domain-containing putative transcriptional regulator [Luedemannella helvata]|uniref:BTAD domain-containing putative transcriptional regulator n=1 Tax=Luedemannella helvata TaxID=349315 RepID=A0ABN2JU55_9ACTN
MSADTKYSLDVLPIDRPNVWVGRESELAVLHAAVGALGRGLGSVVWVEGEAGIGKSSMVAAALVTARDTGCQVLWGTADQLFQRLPLGVMLDCLRVRSGSPDPRRARIAAFLRDRRPGLFEPDDLAHTAIEMLVALVDESCTERATVVVVDDIQWADEASLLVWHRLAVAAEQLPLLLIGICRVGTGRREVRELRAATGRRGTVISLGPLNETDVTALVTDLIGVPPGPVLTEFAARAMGNPLYVCELVDALIRERLVGPAGELPETALDHIPFSYAAALNDRLGVLPARTAQMLRTASLLGGEFRVTELAAVLDVPASELAESVQDTVSAGLVVSVGRELAFRHPLIRQALYEGMPAALRSALHGEAARALAETGADPLRVAQQLLAADQPGSDWARGWVARTASVLVAQAPGIAVELLQRELDRPLPDQDDQQILLVGLARTLLSMGRHAEAATRARQALALAAEPQHHAEMYWVLTRALFSAGDNDRAVEAVRHALAWPELPALWRARLLAMLAMFQRASTGDLDAADATAREALAAGEEAADQFSMAYALIDLWLTHSVRRDHAAALSHVDRALDVLAEDPEHANLRTYSLDARVFTLQNLERWPEAESTLRYRRTLSPDRNDSGQVTSALTAAVLLYWLGRWDDAMAELDAVDLDATEITYAGLRERGPMMLRHGVAAMITSRRAERSAADEHLRAGLDLPIATISDRENSDFLLAAHALTAEQDGNPHAAVSILSGMLNRRPGEMTLTHQWLPDLVRIALDVGDHSAAVAALRSCQSEAAAEVPPARAAAARDRCRGLLNRDPAALRSAAAHYRKVGPSVPLAGTLEDLAATLAGSGDMAEARLVLNEAVDLYHTFGATWDIRRVENRLRQHGVRRGVRGGRPPRPTNGWEALTPTERRVAAMIAEGRSTPRIAQDLYLSRRTVQTHVSHILGKLDMRSRVEIAREALRHGADAAQG